MGTYYSVDGFIPLKPGIDPEAVTNLAEEVGMERTEVRVEETEAGPVLVVSLYGECTYGYVEHVDDHLVSFANQFASAGSVLECETGEGPGLLVVGPSIVARAEAMLVYRGRLLEEAQANLQQAAFALDNARREEAEYGNPA